MSTNTHPNKKDRQAIKEELQVMVKRLAEIADLSWPEPFLYVGILFTQSIRALRKVVEVLSRHEALK